MSNIGKSTEFVMNANEQWKSKMTQLKLVAEN